MPASRAAARAVAAGLTAVAAAWSSPASATVVKAMTLMEKAQSAPVILHGIVQGTEVRWAVPGARVETLVTIEVIESLKGGFEPGERVTFRRGGGKIGDFEQTAPGLSEYEPGEEVIMFLEPLGATFVAIGIGIGKYEVEPRSTGKFVEHQPDVAVLKYGGDSRVPQEIEPHPGMDPEPLPAFLKRVRSYVRGFGVKKTAKPGDVYELKSTPKRD